MAIVADIERLPNRRNSPLNSRAQIFCENVDPSMGTDTVQSPQLSAVRGTIHLVLFLVCLYFGWFFHKQSST